MTLNRSREWWFCRKTCYQYINRDVILSRYSSYLQQEHTFSSIKEHTGNFPRAPIVSPFKKENQAFAQDSRLTLYKKDQDCTLFSDCACKEKYLTSPCVSNNVAVPIKLSIAGPSKGTPASYVESLGFPGHLAFM